MYACSRDVACPASETARRIAACAATPDAESIDTLMFGPRASASPQLHIAQVGSSRCARRKLRIASG